MARLIWITGLSGSGKTTIGKKVFATLKENQPNTVFLDGDHFREVIGQTSGHSREERFLVGMQIARLCKFLVDQDINVVCATISLFKEVHEFNREHFQDYLEVFIDCDMDELVRRDQKGIYTKALRGEIQNVVGIDMAYDRPSSCHLVIQNSRMDQLEENISQIINFLRS